MFDPRCIYLSSHVKKPIYENIFACLHFEQTSVLASLLKVIRLHFERVWSRICIQLVRRILTHICCHKNCH